MGRLGPKRSVGEAAIRMGADNHHVFKFRRGAGEEHVVDPIDDVGLSCALVDDGEGIGQGFACADFGGE